MGDFHPDLSSRTREESPSDEHDTSSISVRDPSSSDPWNPSFASRLQGDELGVEGVERAGDCGVARPGMSEAFVPSGDTSIDTTGEALGLLFPRFVAF
jgi:hypothetical protein